MAVKNLTNQRFGRLVATKHVGFTKHRNALWMCVCDCGNEKLVRQGDLKRKSTRSCGCYRSETQGAYSKLPHGIAAMRSLYLKYRAKAKHRDIFFNISVEDFHRITSNNCYYCNTKPAALQKIRNRTGNYLYNGIDRFDSSLGYIFENCVSCCWICNRAKGDMKAEDFYKWARQLYKNIKSDC